MNEQEKEINLKRVLYKALKNWRKAALVAIAGAIVLGGTKCGVELAKISNQEVVEERQRKYEGELAKYQQQGDLILKEMDNLEATLTRQTEYNENSMLMKIEPHNEWRGSIDFYVETDWQVLPEQAIQAQNPANQIVRVYSTYITNGELYQYVLDRMGSDMEIRYLREVLGGTADAANYLIHFTVRGESQEVCKEILGYIEEGMKAKQSEIVVSVGEFNLLTTNSSTYSQINYDLEQTQKNNRQSITDMNTALSAKQFELMEWEKDEEKIEVPVVSNMDAVKSGIKTAILIGLAFGVAVLVLFGAGYFISKYVQDREEFKGWNVYVGELPRSYRKRTFQWVDCWIGKCFLSDVRASEYSTRLHAVTKQVGEVAKLSVTGDELQLAVVSDIPWEELTIFVDAMNKVQKSDCVDYVAAGNPLLMVESIDTILSADGVVLVARQENSRRETVCRIKEQVEGLKKQLLAVVLTEVDAIM